MPQPKEGSIVHVEIHSADPSRTKQFYGNVFGWTFEDFPEMNYTLWKAPAEPAGGLQKHGDKGPMVLDYIYSKNIDTTLQRISRAGGSVIVPRSEIPGIGWWAVFTEPGGTTMALYEDKPKARPRPARAPTKKAKSGKGKKRK